MDTVRIAAWSGPRNISTAMLRSWENRPDTVVCDEPFYAYYLQQTGLEHPGRNEILAHHETCSDATIASLLEPKDSRVFYQKHMAHHMLPGIEMSWVSHMVNIFLIRDPRDMLTSLIHQIPNPSIEETGLPQQLALFHLMQEQGSAPIVLDSKDILLNPKIVLSALCNELSIPFFDEMLHWPQGTRETDGIWAPHWYSSVEASTGFVPWKTKGIKVPARLETMCLECEDIYKQLRAHKMTV